MKNGNKKRRILFSKQPVVYLFGFLLVVNAIINAVLVKQSISTLREQINERMLDIANSAANLLDGDIMARLQKDDADTAEYQSSLQILRTFQQQIELDYIYGVRDMGNEVFTFTIDPAPDDPGEFGSPVATTQALISASKGIAAVDKEPYHDAWGSFYSAYSPIFDSNGSVAGIVAVDFNSKWYEDQIARQVKIIVFACALSILGGGGIVLLFTRKMRERFQKLNKEMGKMTDEVEQLAEELSLTTGFQSVDAEQYMNPKKQGYAASADLLQEFDDKLKSVRKELRDYIAKAHTMAYTDVLTGIGNRNAYFEAVDRLSKKIGKGQANFAVAIFDINGLKNTNDDFGHECGDIMIRSASEILKVFFPQESLFRIGGDEFVVLMENITAERMALIFDHITPQIDAKVIVRNDVSVPLAISKGFSVFGPEDTTVKAVFQRADNLMYEDKAAYYANHADRRRKR
ncbi:MAG: diguanylate cyclase [Treponema sp.]|nr:diguanylate cyclase [Treponema sp.]